MLYDVKVTGVEQVGDNFLYKLRITDLNTMDYRDIKVRYSQLLDLHNGLQNDNSSYQLPQFPKKDFLKSMFGKETLIVKEREQKLSQYFIDLLKNPPPLHRSLTEFLREGADVIRQQNLMKEVYSKGDYMKNMVFDKILRKGPFGKSTLLNSSGGKKHVLHKFYVIYQHLDQQYNQYFRTHLSITDFSVIAKVTAIFQIKQKIGLMDSIIGVQKMPKTSKKKPFNLFYPQHKIDTCKIYSLEDYEGANLEQVIMKRKKNQDYFSFDELLNIVQRLLSAIIQMHKRNIAINKIMASNILINKEQVKLTGISEPNDRYKEKFVIEGHSLRTDSEYDAIYYPSEKWSQNGQFNPFRVDAWQFGVCIVKAGLLYENKELDGIQNSTSMMKQCIDFLQQRYGDVISNIVDLCLKYNPQTRADIKEIQFLANQTCIIPFETQFLNKITQSKEFITINQIHDLKQLTDFIQKKQQKLCLKVNLYETTLDNDDIDRFFQFLFEFCEVIDLSLVISKCKQVDLKRITSGILQLKSISKLSLDLKQLNFDELDCIALLKNFQENNKKLLIDIQDCVIENQEFLANVYVDGIKIYR